MQPDLAQHPHRPTPTPWADDEPYEIVLRKFVLRDPEPTELLFRPVVGLRGDKLGVSHRRGMRGLQVRRVWRLTGGL